MPGGVKRRTTSGTTVGGMRSTGVGEGDTAGTEGVACAAVLVGVGGGGELVTAAVVGLLSCDETGEGVDVRGEGVDVRGGFVVSCGGPIMDEVVTAMADDDKREDEVVMTMADDDERESESEEDGAGVKLGSGSSIPT